MDQRITDASEITSPIFIELFRIRNLYGMLRLVETWTQ